MWDEEKRLRFHQLRQPARQLTEAEQAELASLVQELEAAEAAYLHGATERMRRECEAIEKCNRVLEVLAHDQEAITQRLSAVLKDTTAS
jgi:hypothetical protein